MEKKDKAPLKEQFYESVEYSIGNLARKGQSLLEDILNKSNQSKVQYETKIKVLAPEYRKSVKAVKELKEIAQALPGKKYALLDMAGAQAKKTVAEVEGYRNVLSLAKRQHKDAEANLEDYKKSILDKDSEYENIQKLVKSGFVKEIGFYEDKGLAWTYPPMVYTWKSSLLFLGRPQVAISNNGEFGLQLYLPSYNNKTYPYTGTLHMRNDPSGTKFCLGGFENVVCILGAKRQISGLIRLMKEYFQSADLKSVFNSELDWPAMRLDKPMVQDDSWDEWLKADPLNKKMAEIPQSDPREQPDDEDDEDYDEEDGDESAF